MEDNDFRQLRRRHADLRDDLNTRQHRRRGLARPPTYLGQVYNGGSMPTSVPSVFLTHPATLVATEAEGGTKTPTAITAYTVPVLVLGPGVPTAGDLLEARQTEGMWVAHVGGGTSTCTLTIFVTGCGGIDLQGATVTVKQGGVTVATGTTGLSGSVPFSLPAGSYDVSAAYTGLVSPSPVNVTLTCPTTTHTIAMATLDSTHICCSGVARPLPKTLTLTADGNTVPFVWTGGGQWEAVFCTTAPGVSYTVSGSTCTPGTNPVPVHWIMQCPLTSLSPPRWQLSQLYGGTALFLGICCPLEGSCSAPFTLNPACGGNSLLQADPSVINYTFNFTTDPAVGPWIATATVTE